jgi:glycosyltransferase involved in cell wall biosynthesis
MKVIQLCGKDFWGAGRAAYRLHKGLQNAGVESVMWVGAKRSNDDSVRNMQAGFFAKKLTKVYVHLEKIYIRMFGGRARDMFSAGKPAHNFIKQIKKEAPDIVHIHWINRGFINLQALKKLNIPVVISLHDMWWFTGGCHYDEYCGRYQEKCGKCPVISSNHEQDLSYKLLQHKNKVLNSIPNLTFIGLSSWMADSIHNSFIGINKNIRHLPNGIDTDKFAPQDGKKLRTELGLPTNKKLVLFAAVDALSEIRKGYSYISNALEYLTSDFELVIIGEKSNDDTVSGLKAHFIGEVTDDSLLVKYFSVADVTVVPSLQENLSNLIMESLSCATPVVSFAIGGNGDMVKHKQTGYLAKECNVEDLAKGIEYCCNVNNNESLSANAREFILNHFNIADVTNKYVELYRSVQDVKLNA